MKLPESILRARTFAVLLVEKVKNDALAQDDKSALKYILQRTGRNSNLLGFPSPKNFNSLYTNYRKFKQNISQEKMEYIKIIAEKYEGEELIFTQIHMDSQEIFPRIPE